MNDAFLGFIVAVLALAVPWDVYVAVKLSMAAWHRPRIGALNAAAFVSTAIAIAATLFAVIGLSGLYFLQTGVRILPQGIGTLFLAIGTLIVSAPSIYLLRLLRRWQDA